MKKTLSMLLAAALICNFSTIMQDTASAIDAATYEEYNRQVNILKESEFPDPNIRYSIITENDFEYHIYDTFAILSECQNTDIIDAVIPASVNGLPVVGCVGTPFGHCHKLSTITLPDTFEHFSWYNLIDNTVVKLGSTEEYIPSVSKIIVSDSNPFYTVENGMLYTKDMKTLIGCPPAMGIKELNISDKADTIGDYAFFACLDLKNAVIPSFIKHLNCNIFTGCLNLESAEIPESITALPGDTFFYCSSLKKVTFKGRIQTIGFGAFDECTALTYFKIPDTVTQIGVHAFKNAGCVENIDGLQYVDNWLVDSDDDIQKAVVREGTVGIAEMSLFSRKNLGYVEIPSSVENLGVAIVSGSLSSELFVIHYRAPHIPEKAIAAAKTSSDIYIYDPDCDIFDSEKTIPATYKLRTKEPFDISVSSTEFQEKYITGDIIIHGYAGSTAQEYAEKYNRKFETITPSGDANGDGNFNISDIVTAQKMFLGSSEHKIKDWKSLDLDNNNKLDSFDLCLLKKKLLKSHK